MDNKEIAGIVLKYRKAANRIILLDYDGTLVDYEKIPENARLSENLSAILKRLIGKSGTEVYIISGRAHREIEKLLNHLPIRIISEHGSMIRKGNDWVGVIPENHLWKEPIIPILRQAVADCPDSYVEEKRFSLAWHYRNADPEAGFEQSRKLIRNLEKSISSLNLKILDGKKVVEILPAEIGKGKAVEKMMKMNNYDFILSIGDDATDEEMFGVFLNIPGAVTIKVGYGDSLARYNIKDIDGVISLLKQLSE
jgi:trehalose 6-phosphate synthase/phosphatase